VSSAPERSALHFASRDRHDEALVALVHPPGWRNPVPRGRYDLVVIGAGTAGLITSLVAASLGAKVALVERHLMGGDCLNVGCVPSKAVIRASRLVQEARRAAELRLLPAATQVPDFSAALERMRAIRARIAHDDSAERYAREFGIDVYFGHAEFAGPASVAVAGAELRFKRAVIATGARAELPPVPGLAEADPLTNETVFSLVERPERLAVIGAGPIGCELAQAFRRLGSQVSLIEQAPQVLTREDPDAAAILARALERDGVELLPGATISRVERIGSERRLHVKRDGREHVLGADAILVGAGRAPNVGDLGLERAGVEFDAKRGVRVDDRLRTRNRRIYAAGDVCMDWKFTHAADAAAKLVVQNALFLGRKRLSSLVMPWCTYTDPEVAHVGLYEREAHERGIALDTYAVPIARANRAVTDGEEEGLVKIHVRKGGDEILGATIVAAHAGELIAALALAMTRRVGLGAFTGVILPYPTQAEAIKAAAGLYTRTRLTPRVKRLFELWLRALR
jgi:pyruvate/2-oxoglutarate dehydrogenase complex dihydrolipoamide dehydrogenase (E3) component